MFTLIITSLLSFLIASCYGDSTFSPARPPSIPLAVRSPYLSTWLNVGSDGGSGGYLAGYWPTFWNAEVTGWTGMIRVDGEAYLWMGDPASAPTSVNQVSFEYTATRSTFVMTVNDAVQLTVAFLSPIFPNDFERQSLVFSYLDVTVESLDGADHDVQLYSDISAEWVSGDRTTTAQWTYGVTGSQSANTKRDEKRPYELPRQAKYRREYPAGNTSTILPLTGSGTSAPTSVTPSVGSTGTAPETGSSSGSYLGSSSGSSSGYTTSGGSAGSSSTSCSSGAGSSSSGSGGMSPSPSPTPSTSWSTSSPPYPKPNSTSSIPWSSPSPPYPSPNSTSNSTIGGIAYHKVWRQDQEFLSEVNDQTEYGYWYYATDNVKGLTHQSGEDTVVRGQFQNNGTLTDYEDTDYRAIDDDWPVFAFAINLGQVNSTPVSTLFSIGLTQEIAVRFDGAEGNVTVPSLWTDSFSTELEALSFFHKDYDYSSRQTELFDNKVETDATSAGGSDYYTITALAVRQAYGALELAGTQNKSYIFMKEISSDGNVNTVDVIFPFMPIAIYTNPTVLKLILDPIFENIESGQWPKPFAIHDIGSNFPNATGHADGVEEDMPVEESGNMLIMTLAYAQHANDVSYLNQHYDLLNEWADWLIDNYTVIPNYQLSTDDFAGALANQTNLALKAIIAIEAMSVISNLTGHQEDSSNYTHIAHHWIRLWQNYGYNFNTTTPHSELNYNNATSWGLLYNLYADSLLHTNLVPSYIYTDQSNFYPTVDDTFGVPLDTRHTYTKLDWEMWCAAIAQNTTQQMFFSEVADWINMTPTNQPLTDLYDAVAGDYPDGIRFAARPVVGGTFALLALRGMTEGKIV